MNFRLFFSCVMLVIAVTGCSAQKTLKMEKRDMVITGTDKSVQINAEIARTNEELTQGLMYREKLADGDGMLFVFDRDDFLSFWMKNTLIPLSIAFISSEGKIMEIRDMEPGNLNPVRSSRSVRYALEVPQGWFDRVNIGVGDKLAIENL
ncbi:MAG: DUF192 domain-containing protein [Treponema sp.]|nr:DUF192 domain-containing protein [Treponema sp.]